MNLVEWVERLYDYPYMDERIERIKAEMQRITEQSQSLSQATLETTVAISARYEQQLEELTGLMEGLICQQDTIRRALFELSREEYRFVELKYFERMKVEAMVRELKRSRRSFYRLGDKVLEKLGKHLCV